MSAVCVLKKIFLIELIETKEQIAIFLSCSLSSQHEVGREHSVSMQNEGQIGSEMSEECASLNHGLHLHRCFHIITIS